MADTKFIAPLPQTIKPGDKIRLQGTLLPNAQEFSINFVNSSCQAPQNITYHMKWFVKDNILVEAYKMNGEWINHREKIINSFQGRSLTQTMNSHNNIYNNNKDNYEQCSTHAIIQLQYIHTNNENKYNDDVTGESAERSKNSLTIFPFIGNNFTLEFDFLIDLNGIEWIYVNAIREYGSTLLTDDYELVFRLSDIQSLQVWGDVAKVNELSFIYK